MAQLVKIQDCVSRYEKNLYHYQSQFIRLRKRRWDNKQQEKPLSARNEGLKQEFRQELFMHQLRWATSTVREVSRLSDEQKENPDLKLLTTDIPDNHFLFYHPVIQYRNIPVELDIVLAGPAVIWLIVWVPGEGIFKESGKRFWIDELTQKKRLSPLVNMERMEQILKDLTDRFNIHLQFKKAIIAKDGYIDMKTDWRKVEFIDKRTFLQWHRSLLHEPGPVKKNQIQFVEELLKKGITNSLYREESHEMSSGYEEKEGILEETHELMEE